MLSYWLKLQQWEHLQEEKKHTFTITEADVTTAQDVTRKATKVSLQKNTCYLVSMMELDSFKCKCPVVICESLLDFVCKVFVIKITYNSVCRAVITP